MNAELMLKQRHIISEDAFVEMVVWRSPSPVEGNRHGLKYRLAFVVRGRCVLRYDNERGKGDHKHIDNNKTPYTFTSPQALLDDSWHDVNNWRS